MNYKNCIAAIVLLSTAGVALGQSSPKACPESPEVYRQRYLKSAQQKDWDCWAPAFQRETKENQGNVCPFSSSHYMQLALKNNKTSDHVCFAKALKRETGTK